jgi:hypothetical protein
MSEASTGSSAVTASPPSGSGGSVTEAGRIIAAAVLASRADMPDAQPPGDQLQQRPPPLGRQRIQPALDQPLNLVAFGGRQGVDHLAQLGLAVRPPIGIAGPDQGDRLGQVADIVVGPAEQHGIHPRLDRPPDHRRLGRIETQIPGQGRQRPAPVRIGRRLQIVAQQHQLRIARRGQGQTIQKLGEGAQGRGFQRRRQARPHANDCGPHSFRIKDVGVAWIRRGRPWRSRACAVRTPIGSAAPDADIDCAPCGL